MRALPSITGRAGAASAVAALAIVLLASPAGAHVTVAADDPTQGAEDAILTFRVPNEEDNARTVKLQIKFPAKDPIASVKPAPKPGWTITTTTVKFDPPIKTDDGTITEGVGEVVYTATSPANGIPVGGFEAFQVLVGPLPDAASIAFPTVQTYSNCKTSSWVQPVTDPENPPDNPTPVLTLTAAEAAATPATSSSATGPAVAATTTADLSGYATTSDASTARTLGIIGLIVGLAGLIMAGVALARSRRTAADQTGTDEPTHST
jgi:uncharacterized protein YcnI